MVLPPGTLLSECSVVRQQSSEGIEPYLVHFAAGGRQYCCPLYIFQPRTEAISPESADLQRAASAVAV